MSSDLFLPLFPPRLPPLLSLLVLHHTLSLLPESPFIRRFQLLDLRRGERPGSAQHPRTELSVVYPCAVFFGRRGDDEDAEEGNLECSAPCGRGAFEFEDAAGADWRV